MQQRVFLRRRTAAARSIKHGGIVRERRDVFAYELARARLQAGVLMQCTAAVLLRRRAHIKTAPIEECLDRIQRCVIGYHADAAIEHLPTLLAPVIPLIATSVCLMSFRDTSP